MSPEAAQAELSGTQLCSTQQVGRVGSPEAAATPWGAAERPQAAAVRRPAWQADTFKA